jgi:hypothetical protein
VRGTSGSLSPSWAPPEHESIPLPKDTLLLPLGLGAAAVFLLVCVVSLAFWLAQRSWLAELRP